MNNKINEIFEKKEIIQKIKSKLPYLFQLAEVDNSRDGKLGMEVGSARERIVIAMLIYNYGEENVKTDISITEKETDVILFDKPISIKTFTNKKIVGVKLIWTVDAQKALEFQKNYNPDCDILLVHINWGGKGAMYLLPKEAQQEVLKKLGRETYFKLPKGGTNPRGVEISAEAINKLVQHINTKMVTIEWNRDDSINYDAYDRWIEYWKKD